jgi:hypothetical protein
MSKRLKSKPFNGKCFIKYLRQHPPFKDESTNYSSSTEPFSKDSAIRYAQNLLESNYLLSAVASNEKRKSSDTHLKNQTKTSRKNTSMSMLSEQPNDDDDQHYFIYLATKSYPYRLNLYEIERLTDRLLFKNAILNQELEILYPKLVSLIDAEIQVKDSTKLSTLDSKSSLLFDECLEKNADETVSNLEQPSHVSINQVQSIDQDFVMRILWHRVYTEPLVMKFISLRQSNYFYFNQNLSKAQRINQLFYNVATSVDKGNSESSSLLSSSNSSTLNKHSSSPSGSYFSSYVSPQSSVNSREAVARRENATIVQSSFLPFP